MGRIVGGEAEHLRAQAEDCLREMEVTKGRKQLERKATNLIVLLSKMQEANHRRVRKNRATSD